MTTTASECVHKFGFTDPRDFVMGLLHSGFEPGQAFLEVLCEQCPDLDPDDVEGWIEEWQREAR